MNKLISSQELRKKLGQNARNVAKAFDKKIWEEKWHKLLIEKLK